METKKVREGQQTSSEEKIDKSCVYARMSIEENVRFCCEPEMHFAEEPGENLKNAEKNEIIEAVEYEEIVNIAKRVIVYAICYIPKKFQGAVFYIPKEGRFYIDPYANYDERKMEKKVEIGTKEKIGQNEGICVYLFREVAIENTPLWNPEWDGKEKIVFCADNPSKVYFTTRNKNVYGYWHAVAEDKDYINFRDAVERRIEHNREYVEEIAKEIKNNIIKLGFAVKE